MWGDTELGSSLFDGTSVLEAMGPSLVEKVWVPESHMLSMRKEWDRASGANMKDFRV
jgi:hypothetical protein